MKNKKPIPPAPIICRLVNNEEKNPAHVVIFTLISLILTVKEHIVLDYFTHLNYYTLAQFNTFCSRILDKRNKVVSLNQQHFITYFSILHITIQLYQSKEIIDFLKAESPIEKVEEFDAISINFINFCNIALDELRKEYKNNYAIAAAFTKIEVYRIPS